MRENVLSIRPKNFGPQIGQTFLKKRGKKLAIGNIQIRSHVVERVKPQRRGIDNISGLDPLIGQGLSHHVVVQQIGIWNEKRNPWCAGDQAGLETRVISRGKKIHTCLISRLGKGGKGIVIMGMEIFTAFVNFSIPTENIEDSIEINSHTQ